MYFLQIFTNNSAQIIYFFQVLTMYELEIFRPDDCSLLRLAQTTTAHLAAKEVTHTFNRVAHAPSSKTFRTKRTGPTKMPPMRVHKIKHDGEARNFATLALFYEWPTETILRNNDGLNNSDRAVTIRSSHLREGTHFGHSRWKTGSSSLIQLCHPGSRFQVPKTCF